MQIPVRGENMMNRKQCEQNITAMLIVIFLLLICFGCQTVRSHRRADPALLDRVLSGEALLGDRAAMPPQLPHDDIFEITPEMHEFLEMNVPSAGSDYFKLQRLIKAMMDTSSMDWKLDPFKTYSAADTFHSRRGSCLSYAIMMVVLGRELGLELYFNEVYIPSTWDIQKENTLVLFQHVNVLAEADGRRMILDLELEDYDSSYPQNRITDIAAEAHYYNNLGAEYLNNNDREQAFLYFLKALTLLPERAFLWINMGVLHLRYGHYREAEAALLRALELDSANISAINNLQTLYVKQGNSELASYYKQEAERSRMKNPYYRYFLAKKLMDEDKLDSALKHIKWSIRRYGREHRFHFLEAQIYTHMGKYDDAKESLKRAVKLTADDKNRLLYKSKMARLREIPGHESDTR